MLRFKDDEASEGVGNDAEGESGHVHGLLLVGTCDGGGYWHGRKGF